MASTGSQRLRRAIRALKRRPEARAVARAARERGLSAWIVGGAVRDAALGLPVPEIDVAVDGDAEGLSRALAEQGLGTSVFLSRDRPGPRVFRVAGPRPLDIAEVEGGSMLADLARRDYTVNAIAVPLQEDEGEVLDPFGGLADLARGRLRPVHPDNLLSDPLRVLRAARLIATHGLRPDSGTLLAARRAAQGLSRVAPERIAAELSKLLAARSAHAAFSWAARAGILPAALRLPLSRQEAQRVARSLGVLEGRAIRGLAPERRRRLRLAYLASRLSSPPDARRWLRALRFSRREAEEVASLLSLARSAVRIGSRREAIAWLLEAGDLAADALILLSVAGSKGRRLSARLRRLARNPLRRVPVTGGDVVRWLSIPPGPRVGELLERLRLESALGAVRNRREARTWLSGQGRGLRDRL